MILSYYQDIRQNSSALFFGQCMLGECLSSSLCQIPSSQFYFASTISPLPDPTDIPLPSLLSIAEIALKYSFKALKTWAIDGVQTLVTSHDTPLRTAPTEIFIRMLRLSLIYHRPDLGVSIQNKWITRIHWHELPPVPAILMADMHDLQYLLSHALYVHMVNMAPRIAAGKRIDGDSPLTPNQNLHIFCGYNSLAAYWTHLRSEAPAFVAAPKCASHDLCKAAWEQKWFEVMKGPMVYLNVDVLRRLMFVGSVLEEDRFLKVCMKEGCLRSALESVSRKRTDISNNLHHHFDL